MDTLYIVRNSQVSTPMNRTLRKGSKAIYPGSALLGSVFDRIIVMVALDEQGERWFNECVRCRLSPGGDLIYA